MKTNDLLLLGGLLVGGYLLTKKIGEAADSLNPLNAISQGVATPGGLLGENSLTDADYQAKLIYDAWMTSFTGYTPPVAASNGSTEGLTSTTNWNALMADLSKKQASSTWDAVSAPNWGVIGDVFHYFFSPASSGGNGGAPIDNTAQDRLLAETEAARQVQIDTLTRETSADLATFTPVLAPGYDIFGNLKYLYGYGGGSWGAGWVADPDKQDTAAIQGRVDAYNSLLAKGYSADEILGNADAISRKISMDFGTAYGRT